MPTCTIFEVETQFTVIRPEAITAVTLERVQWDDRVQLWLGKAGEEQLVYTGPGPFPETYAGVSYPNGLLPPETPGDCELSESWDRSPNLDVTDAFLAGVEAGDRVRLFSRVSVHGGGELFARLRIDYDRDLAIDDTAWTPADCVASAQAIEDGFATGSISCLATPVEVPAGSGCTHINGVTVCESDLNPSPFVGVSSLCEQVEITTEYNFYVGDYTYIDETGTEVTITGGGGDLDRCSAYEADSSCAFVAQTCVEGAEVDGNCYVYEETWDCGYAVEVREVASETTYDCAGPISCMGMDCIDPTPESSESFAETAALLNAVQYMAQDTNCVPIDGTEDVICDIFGGENHYCKIAVGGAQDCCDVPTGVNVFDYLQAIRSMARLDSALMAVDIANPALGAYRTLRAPIAKSVSYVTKPFTTAVENVKGTVSKIVEPIGTFIDGVKTKVQNAVKDVLTKMFRSAGTGVNGAGAAAGGTNMLSDEATEEAADQAAEAAAEGVMENMASAANVMMTAFAIYSATMLAIQLLYECEDQEFQLASKRDVEACNHVGSYCHSDSPFGCIENRRTFCCYNSPLSRIINPQIKAQLGLDMGTDEAPNCSGFTIDQITATDWSLIDLSEWNALLTDNGLFPDETMDMDSLTGTGSELQSINEVAGDADRLNATDRATERLDGLDIDALNREAYENTAVNADGR
ncbi:MAG: conjugal transfer mating pair stabilization protein TraN [Cellvibrionaceae bacterium]|nr:conjugal transfer mating pair stabilization protein TraN [Cellvibrionaceae bacterium]